MKNSKQVLLVFCFIASMLLLSGCSIAQLGIGSEPEQSILTSQPCAPPCWQDIVPGQTSGEKAWQLLQSNPYVLQFSLARQPFQREDSERESMTWLPRHQLNPDFLYIQRDVVQTLDLIPEIPLSLGQVVKKYGNPGKFLVWIAVGEDPNWRYNIRLYYPRIGLAVYLHTSPPEGNDPFTLSEGMLVSRVEYFPAGSLNELFAIGGTFLPAEAWSEAAERYVQDWNGFGRVDVAPYGFP